MAKCVSRTRRFCDLILDFIWPSLRGPAGCEPRDQDHFGAMPAELLDEAGRILASRLAQVEKRGQTVESKLIALLTLTSVLSAAVIVSLAATTALDKAKEIPSIFACVAIIVVFYLVVQLLCLLLATVRGLERRSYRQLSLADITARSSETSEQYKVRLLNAQANYMCSNELEANHKVSVMAVAHTALRNVLYATFALIVLALALAFVHLEGGSSDCVANLVLVSCEAFDHYPPGLPGRLLCLNASLPGGAFMSV